MKKILAASLILLSLALGGCSSDNSPRITALAEQPRIVLDVRSISLADRTLPTSDSLYTLNRFSPTIAESVRKWAANHLQAVGQTGQAIIVLKDASLTAQPLPKKSGMDSWFTRQQSVRYTGRAELSIEVKGIEGGKDSFGTVEASAIRSVTLPEDPHDMEKQDAYEALLTGLMTDLQEHLNEGIRAHLSRFVITAPLSPTLGNLEQP